MTRDIAFWAERAVKKLYEAVDWNLSEEETEHFLRTYFGDQYDYYISLIKAGKFPTSNGGRRLGLNIQDLSGPYCLNWTAIIQATSHLPVLYNQYHNYFSVEQHLPWRDGLPARMVEAIEQALQFHAAIRDVSNTCKTYKRARYLLTQWSNAASFLPDYVRKTMRSRQFVRPVPKKVQPFKPETLQTLALMSLIEPYPET
jgi:hypothetical protein